MRRKDRELTAEEGLAIIDACEYGTISCITDEDEIFSVPISVVREEGSVFLHGAPAAGADFDGRAARCDKRRR